MAPLCTKLEQSLGGIVFALLLGDRLAGECGKHLLAQEWVSTHPRVATSDAPAQSGSRTCWSSARSPACSISTWITCAPPPKLVVMDLSAVPYMDMHGAHMLADLAEELESSQ